MSIIPNDWDDTPTDADIERVLNYVFRHPGVFEITVSDKNTGVPTQNVAYHGREKLWRAFFGNSTAYNNATGSSAFEAWKAAMAILIAQKLTG